MSNNDVYKQFMEFHKVYRSNVQERPRHSKVRPSGIHVCVLMVPSMFLNVVCYFLSKTDVECPSILNIHIYVRIARV